ncbi:Ulp1 family isopeptidase, partial [Wolbachia endosymbiont of Bemisia tabaci]|uniref:Ulp1 family isopeptidase n=1 Tax=Wolbachia endosymbiont of Bemisia tabaci TaxID=215173 RepID=UPI0021059E44
FKSGVKYSSYLYLGATVASLFAAFASVPGVLTLVASNPVAWAVLGVAFIVLSGVAISVAKPLFHWAKDSINQRKFEKGEEKTISSCKIKDSINQREIEKEEGKAISDYKTLDNKLGTPSIRTTARLDAQEKDTIASLLENSVAFSEFMQKTNRGDYEFELDYVDIIYIAYNTYGYLPCQIENNVYFFACKPEQISDKTLALELRDYKETVKRRPDLVFTSVINLSNHYVTLVVAYDNKNKNFRACYCNPFGGLYDKVNRVDEKLLRSLKKEFDLKEQDIRISEVEQQERGKDGWNCGIYALENAKIMTDMMKEGRSFAEIDKELAKYQLSQEELKNKRIEFAKGIEEDQDRDNISFEKYPPLSFMEVPELSGGPRLRGCY